MLAVRVRQCFLTAVVSSPERLRAVKRWGSLMSRGGQVTRAAVQDLFWKDPDCDRSPNFTFVLTEPMLSSFLFAGEQNQNHGATGPGRTMSRQPRLSRPLSSPELQGRWQKPRCSSHTHKPIRNFTRTESFCGLKTKDKLLYFF